MSSTTLLQLGSRSKPGSTWKARVSPAQQQTIEDVASSHSETIDLDKLVAYVNTGDLAQLDSSTHALLTTIVAQCKNRAPSPSQAKRYWPRKVAAVIYDAIS